MQMKHGRTPMIAPTTAKKEEHRIFFHYQYHPRNISRQVVQNTYESICELQNQHGHSFKNILTSSGEKLRINRLIIYYSRATNLRDNWTSSHDHTSWTRIFILVQHGKILHDILQNILQENLHVI